MMKEQQIRHNLKAVANAVAQQKLEGLKVPSDVAEEMNRAARGEIKIEDGIHNTIRKFGCSTVSGVNYFVRLATITLSGFAVQLFPPDFLKFSTGLP